MQGTGTWTEIKVRRSEEQEWEVPETRNEWGMKGVKGLTLCTWGVRGWPGTLYQSAKEIMAMVEVMTEKITSHGWPAHSAPCAQKVRHVTPPPVRRTLVISGGSTRSKTKMVWSSNEKKLTGACCKKIKEMKVKGRQWRGKQKDQVIWLSTRTRVKEIKVSQD